MNLEFVAVRLRQLADRVASLCTIVPSSTELAHQCKEIVIQLHQLAREIEHDAHKP